MQGNIHWCIIKRQKQVSLHLDSWKLCLLVGPFDYSTFLVKTDTLWNLNRFIVEIARDAEIERRREDWMVLDTVSMSSLSIHKHEYVRLWSTVTPFFRMGSDIHLSNLALNRKILKQLFAKQKNELANSINCSFDNFLW